MTLANDRQQRELEEQGDYFIFRWLSHGLLSTDDAAALVTLY